MRYSLTLMALLMGLAACDPKPPVAEEQATADSTGTAAQAESDMPEADGYTTRQLFGAYEIAGSPDEKVTVKSPAGWTVSWQHAKGRASYFELERVRNAPYLFIRVCNGDPENMAGWAVIDSVKGTLIAFSADFQQDNMASCEGVSPDRKYVLIDDGTSVSRSWQVFDATGKMVFACGNYDSNQRDKGGLPAGWQPDGSLIYYQFPDEQPKDLPASDEPQHQYIAMHQWKDGKSTFTGKYFLVFVQ